MKKKILFTIESLGGGGAEKILLNIINNLDREKFEITLYLFFLGGIYDSDLGKDVKIKYIFKDVKKMTFVTGFFYKIYRLLAVRLLTLYPRFIKYFVKINMTYDLGVSFCEGLNSVIIIQNAKNFIKKIGWIHIDFNLHKANISNEKISKYYKKFDKIVFVSQDSMKAFKRNFNKISDDKFLVIYNPIDFSSIMRISETISFDKNKFTFISVGRFNKQKRFDKVIEIANKCCQEKIDIQFFIVGEGELEKEYRKKIAKYNLENYVFLFPFQKNVVSWIKKADVFLMTSDYEGLPVVICEAMILEKPIVSTNITGPKELLEYGKYGILSSTDTNEIFEKVKEIYFDSVKRKYYQNILKMNKSRFIFKDNISEIEKFLENV